MSTKINTNQNNTKIEEYYCAECGEFENFEQIKETDELHSIWTCSKCEREVPFQKYIILEPAKYSIRYYLIDAPEQTEASEWYETGSLEPIDESQNQSHLTEVKNTHFILK